MREFLDESERLLARNRTGEFERDFERVFSAISQLQKAHSKSDLDLYDVESVFSAFDMISLLGAKPFEVGIEISDLINSFTRVVAKTLEETVVFEKNSQNEPAPTHEYAALAELISDIMNDSGAATVLTFNYDIALDFAISKTRRMWPAYHIPGEKLSENRRPVSLLKLHGSLNWTIKDGRPISVDVSNSNLFDNLTNGLYRCRIASKLSQIADVDNAAPLIVPPTWNKSRHQESISSVWREAGRALSGAESIYVCGFSMPPTDQFFKYLYALGTIGEKLLRRFAVFDYDDRDGPDSLKHRYLALLGTGVHKRFDYLGGPKRGGLGQLVSVAKEYELRG